MKKIISLIIIVLMCLSLIFVSSCDNKNNDNNQPTEENESSENTGGDNEDENTQTTQPAHTYTSVDISQFKILFSDNTLLDAAAKFKETIKSKCKVILQVKRASQDAMDKYQFLINASGFGIGDEHFSAGFSKACLKYGYIIDHGTVLLLGYEEETLNKSISLFINKYLKNGSVMELEDNISVIHDIEYAKEKIPDSPNENEIRVMSNNVIRARYAAPLPRLSALKVAYVMFDADVIGLQECGEEWLKNGKLTSTLKEIGYELVPYTDPRCSNPLFYRPETVKLIESGDVQYDENDAVNDVYRSYAWGYFEQISTGKRFIVTSTHLHPNNNTIREKTAEQLSKDLNALELKYGVPVIAVGDYNSDYNSRTYSTMRLQLESARIKCEKKVNMSFKTFLGDIGKEPALGTAIDHCFYSQNGVSGKLFQTITSDYAGAYTDHLAIIFDFTLE